MLLSPVYTDWQRLSRVPGKDLVGIPGDAEMLYHWATSPCAILKSVLPSLVCPSVSSPSPPSSSIDPGNPKKLGLVTCQKEGMQQNGPLTSTWACHIENCVKIAILRTFITPQREEEEEEGNLERGDVGRAVGKAYLWPGRIELINLNVNEKPKHSLVFTFFSPAVKIGKVQRAQGLHIDKPT